MVEWIAVYRRKQPSRHTRAIGDGAACSRYWWSVDSLDYTCRLQVDCIICDNKIIKWFSGLTITPDVLDTLLNLGVAIARNHGVVKIKYNARPDCCACGRQGPFQSHSHVIISEIRLRSADAHFAWETFLPNFILSSDFKWRSIRIFMHYRMVSCYPSHQSRHVIIIIPLV